jgi:hypothetical protein
VVSEALTLYPPGTQTHIGTENCTKNMESYIFARNKEGIHIINLNKTWEKLMLAARVIAAIQNPKDILVRTPFFPIRFLNPSLRFPLAEESRRFI